MPVFSGCTLVRSCRTRLLPWSSWSRTLGMPTPQKSISAGRTVAKAGHSASGTTGSECRPRTSTGAGVPIFYNRADSQGLTVQAPKELPNAPARHVYGRNGKGRTAGFSFSSPYRVRTWRDGHEAIFLVRRGATDPIDPKLERERDNVDGHGTEITGVETGSVLMSAEQARAALSTNSSPTLRSRCPLTVCG